MSLLLFSSPTTIHLSSTWEKKELLGPDSGQSDCTDGIRNFATKKMTENIEKLIPKFRVVLKIVIFGTLWDPEKKKLILTQEVKKTFKRRHGWLNNTPPYLPRC